MSVWRKCSVCKTDLLAGQRYYVCSVSSCNLKRAPTQFCSVTCWDTHNAVLGHRSAGAEEKKAPAIGEPENRRRVIVQSKSSGGNSRHQEEEDVLVVVSKLKAYIKRKSDFNTSGDVMACLSDIMRRRCDDAIENARINGRKTVMARDFN